MTSLSPLRQAGSPLRLLLPAALVFAGQVLGLLWGVQTLRQAEAQLATKQRNFSALERSPPAPTQAVAAALATDIAAARVALAEAESLWRDNAITRALSTQSGAVSESSLPPLPPLPPLPLNRRAAYFDLARYRQSMTQLAQEHGAELGPDPYFGFGDYANEGPEEADISRVYKQRLVLESVVGALLRSSPQRLLAVIRESAAAELSAVNAATQGEANASHPPPRDFVSRDPFQIRFLGRTVALRDWLNALADMSLPIFVRSINVEPSAEAGGRQIVSSVGRANPPTSPLLVDEIPADGFELLVSPTESDFVVTLEYVELLDDPVAVTPSEASEGERVNAFRVASAPRPLDVAPTGPRWPAPQPQPRGAQWVYEVFTPPEIFHHAPTRQFRVKPVPSSTAFTVAAAALTAPNENATLRLLAVRPEDYPLQLVGYLSDWSNGALLGIFENKPSGETFLLSVGDRVESLGIEILSLKVERFIVETAAAENPASTLPRPLRAVAGVRDTIGELRTLHQGERAAGSVLIAWLELGGEVRALRAGEKWENADGLLLEVEKIEAEPSPRVFLKRHRSGDAEPEALWLELDSPQ